jgi:hypothetical protein
MAGSLGLEAAPRSVRLDMLVLNAGVGRGEPARIWMANYIGPFLFTSLFSPILTATAVEHGDVRIVAVSGGAPQSTTKTRGNPGLPTRGQRPCRLWAHVLWAEQVGAGYAYAPTPTADATASDIGGRGAVKVLCGHVGVRDDKYCLGRRAQGPLSAAVANLPLLGRVFPLSVT